MGGKGCRFGLERGPLRRKSGYGDGGEKYGGLMSVCVCVCVCVCVSNPTSCYSTRSFLPLLLQRSLCSFSYSQHTHLSSSYHLLRGLLFRPKPVRTAANAMKV